MAEVQTSSSPQAKIYYSDYIDEEPFFGDLKDLGYGLEKFPRLTQKDALSGPSMLLFHERFLLQEFSSLLDHFAGAQEKHPVILIGEKLSADYVSTLFRDRAYLYLQKPVGLKKLSEAVRECAIMAEKGQVIQQFEKQLRRAQDEIKDLRMIGIALSAERDPVKLLELILTKSRQIAEADAASLYLVESETSLRFKLTQNTSLDWQMRENRVIPIDEKSLAGYVAKTALPLNLLDVYFIPPTYPFTFNRSFDEKSGYRTKSMIVVPMKNQAGEVLGVIQLINKRSDYEFLKPGIPLRDEMVLPFSRDDLDLLQTLASQAAIALENSKLYEDIKNLFEGFVKASVVAIESRDPTTSGHSERVATLTLAFARKVDELKEGPFASVRFSDKDLTEIRYASLLHDFGKVGVREEVLVKAKKLFPPELEILKQRYKFLRKSMEADYYKNCLECVLGQGRDKFEMMRPAIDASFQTQMEELEDILDFLLRANEPTVLEEGNFQRLLEIARQNYQTLQGESIEYVTPREIQVLSIRKGSLSEVERTEIESHVSHTFNFLSKIPWTRSLQRIPEIAYAHHEKLNGRGYPNHLEAKAIPFESKLMTISDIFDALTARDRPYKRALPHEKAFDIMYNEVTQGLLSKELLDIFVQGKIYKVIE